MFASGKTAAVSSAATYIEDVFSTYLYTGNGSTQTITNGIDLAGKGGLVWMKDRVDGALWHQLFNTVSGGQYSLASNGTDIQYNLGGYPTRGVQFNSNGFSFIDTYNVGVNGDAGVSWTFRKQPKFFDVVTYTGTGSNTTISHSLGSVPACIMVKRTDTAGDWQVYHSSLANTEYLVLNTTAAKATGATRWNSTTPTSTVFSIGTDATVNASGGTYVAYLFAHDAGGFGLTGTDNVISCGSAADGNSLVTLGYEPQWVLIKGSQGSIGVGDNWLIADAMRGMVYSGNTPYLAANLSSAEDFSGGGGSWIKPTATGFQLSNLSGTGPFIYIAIRRGPMKVPTSGTSVFSAQTGTYSAGDSLSVGFPADMYIDAWRTGTLYKANYSRLVNFANSNSSASQNYLKTNTTDAEVTTSQAPSLYDLWNTTAKVGSWNQGVSEVWWMFRRAPSFFDEVCYTGAYSASVDQVVNHNLTVSPELLILKKRSGAGDWAVISTALGLSKYLVLNSTATSDSFPFVSSVTSTTFSLGKIADNYSATGVKYVAYLFATCAGVSKVGSYTGTGATLQVDCGFTGGARFVLIKRTDSTGDWYVWDSARGIVAGNDPYLLLNSTAAEVTNTDYVDTYSAGFEISSTAPAAINASGGTFIFLAIA